MAATPGAVLLAPGVPMIELVVGPEDDNLLRRFAASDLGHQVDTIDRLDLVLLLLNLVSHGFEGVPDMVGSYMPLAGSPEMAIADVERQRVDMVLQPVTGGLLRPVERLEGSTVACALHPEHAIPCRGHDGGQDRQRQRLAANGTQSPRLFFLADVTMVRNWSSTLPLVCSTLEL